MNTVENLHWASYLVKHSKSTEKSEFLELWNRFTEEKPNEIDCSLLDFSQKSDQFIVPLGADLYPPELLQMKRPPPVIYLKGNVALLRKRKLSIVGTRNATPIGKARTENWARYLVEKKNWVIVSGLALGIDQAAHTGAHPQTIAVLAFGHGHHYPRENHWLREKIETEGGLTLSIKKPNEKCLRSSFLERNCIMAALSQKVLVMEAPLHSGALFTAYRMSEGLGDVMAVPGNPEQIHYAGNIKLIQEGAWPLFHPDEVGEA